MRLDFRFSIEVAGDPKKITRLASIIAGAIAVTIPAVLLLLS